MSNAPSPRSSERPTSPGSGNASPAARNTPSSQPAGDSTGSRAGSSLGSATERTGLGDGTVSDSSQGLTGAQGSGGGADRRPAGAPLRSPPGGEGEPGAEGEDSEAGEAPRYRPDEEAS